jgi:hypothetical protein
MIPLLGGFHFFYNDWGSMIAISFTIASAFIAVNAALRAKSLAVFPAKIDERVLQDEELADVLKRFDRVFIREVKDPVEIAGKLVVFFLEALATEALDRRGQDPLKAEDPGSFFDFAFQKDRGRIEHVRIFNLNGLCIEGALDRDRDPFLKIRKNELHISAPSRVRIFF